MELVLGASISPESVFEGGDVYFDCRIRARPPPKRIVWQFDVSRDTRFGRAGDKKAKGTSKVPLRGRVDQGLFAIPLK